MNRMQITKLTIALMAVMTAFSTHAVEQNGISHGMFSFAEDVTILANASSGVDNIYSAISATKNNTTVTIADGKTINIKGDLSDNHIGGIFLISSQTNYELNVAGDISGQITTSLNKSIRGISALGNIDINGNVELVIDGGPSNVIGVGAWNGSQLRFSGESTKINIRTSLAQSSSVYGVQGSGANTVISFNANNNSIVVDNSSENKSYSYGVSTTSSLINFSGNPNITVFSNYGETYGVNVINNIGCSEQI